MTDVLKTIGEIGVVPVIKVEDVGKAADLAGALKNGGIPVAEVTFRAAGADKAIAAMRATHPDMLVGAGTVLTVDQVKLAAEAGAQFMVSPGFNPKVVGYCVEHGIPITPGCITPSEIEQALEFGLTTVKFFPSEQSGGLAKMKALAGPYGGLKFIPTGGIDLKNLAEYLAYDRILACGGSFMVKEEYIKNGEWDKITALSRQAVDIVLGFSLVHVGINTGGEDEARSIVDGLSAIWPQPVSEIPNALFLGNAFVEVLKTTGIGRNGHIAIGTTSVERAMAHLKRRGVAFDESTLAKAPNGKARFVYLAGEYGGFGVHLRLKD